jgi:hypothetical protein
VVAILERYDAWLQGAGTPKLLLTFDAPSVLLTPEDLAWARACIAALEHRGRIFVKPA